MKEKKHKRTGIHRAREDFVQRDLTERVLDKWRLVSACGFDFNFSCCCCTVRCLSIMSSRNIVSSAGRRSMYLTFDLMFIS